MSTSAVPPRRKVRLSGAGSDVRRETSLLQRYETGGADLLKTIREGVMRTHGIKPGESPYVLDAASESTFIITHDAVEKMRDLVDVLAELEAMLATNGGTLVISIEVRQ